MWIKGNNHSEKNVNTWLNVKQKNYIMFVANIRYNAIPVDIRLDASQQSSTPIGAVAGGAGAAVIVILVAIISFVILVKRYSISTIEKPVYANKKHVEWYVMFIVVEAYL